MVLAFLDLPILQFDRRIASKNVNRYFELAAVGFDSSPTTVPVNRSNVPRTVEIISRRVPAASTSIAEQAAAAVARLRTLDVQKPPGIAEAINWVSIIELLGVDRLDAEVATQTLGSVLKYREDLDVVHERGVAWVVGE